MDNLFLNRMNSRQRIVKKKQETIFEISIGICLIFRGLFFEHNTEIGQKDHLWMDTKEGVMNHSHNPFILWLRDQDSNLD
jgi:hypothetical protein